MSKHTKILELITEIRNSHSEMSNIFSKGSCWNFHLILKVIFPNAQAFCDSDHIITKIDGKFYDITGEINKTKGYAKMEDYYSTSSFEKVKKVMHNSEYKIKT